MITIIIKTKLCELARVARILDITGCTQIRVGLAGNSTYAQKGVASLSCGRESRFDIEYPARIFGQSNAPANIKD